MSNSNEQLNPKTDQPASHHASPPRARLTLRVGVTGHRPNKLQSAEKDLLLGRIRVVLEMLREATVRLHMREESVYRSDLPILRVISPLAEGSDRLVAQLALTMRFELQSPLPFRREEYRKDFKTQESLAEFGDLLSKANSILELDGSRKTPERQLQSYEAVGRTVLSQSDVLIAIWDGEKTGSRGGTSQMMDEADRSSIPLIWINSKTPHAIMLKLNQDDNWLAWEKGSAPLLENLKALLVEPPQVESESSTQSKRKSRRDLREAYFRESRRRWIPASLWKLFRDLVAFRTLAVNVKSGPPHPFLKEVSQQIDTALGDHYAWADRLADYYANVYRSAFVFNYLMSACAVLFAFLGYAFHGHERVPFVFYFTEVLVVFAVIFITLLGTKRSWHKRWIDYRLLAEHLRQAQFLMTLGRVSADGLRLPTRISGDDPRNSWMYWHLRALVREAGMVQARFDGGYLGAVKESFNRNGINGQIRYHELNAALIEKISNRLHHLGITLFLLAFFAAILHFFIHENPWAVLLALVTIVGPAFGASLAAIRSQGEFDRLTKRSRAMSSQLKRISHQLDRLVLQDDDLSSLTLSEIAVNGAQLMVDEVLDWRIVFQERPLDWPS